MAKRPRKPVIHWLESAVDRVREFAYTEPSPAPVERPRIGVALGGGFARGIAHLGVLNVLKQEKIPVDYLTGTSAGALMAISFASGHTLSEIERQARATRFQDFGNWKLSWMGLASNQKLEHYPRKFLGVSTFEDLTVPLAIAATDLATGEAVYFSHGPLGPALRASCAYPGMFIPVEIDGRMLVDGFLAAPVPVDAARSIGAEIVIAVFLEAANNRKPSSIVDVIGLSFAILQRHADLEWRRTADVTIEPAVKDFLWDDFERTSDLIAAGETAARAALPKIRAVIAEKTALKSPPLLAKDITPRAAKPKPQSRISGTSAEK
ncbi:MAG TPA: patatin-like phospholipase family protein [Candidatus Acidoferrales bacterium]|nr:patatin-like phospholipase family protein [Candidatus Acidoferrales bacterium]